MRLIKGISNEEGHSVMVINLDNVLSMYDSYNKHKVIHMTTAPYCNPSIYGDLDVLLERIAEQKKEDFIIDMTEYKE